MGVPTRHSNSKHEGFRVYVPPGRCCRCPRWSSSCWTCWTHWTCWTCRRPGLSPVHHAVHAAPVVHAAHHAVHAPVVAHPVAHAVHAAPVVAHAVHAAPAYHAPVKAGYVADDLAEQSPYTFTYAVADDYSKASFNAEESSDGASNVQGSYSVALPDGRIQHVK